MKTWKRAKLTTLASVLAMPFFLGLVTSSSTADASTGPQAIVLQGRLLKANDEPVTGSNVSFTLQVRTPGTEDCVLYEETHTVNMTGTNGVFTVTLGSGTRVGSSTAFKDTSTLIQSFDNSTGALSSLSCANGSSYTAQPGHKRKLKITFDDQSGAGPQTFADAMEINTVPYALIADTLRGKTPSDFVQVADTNSQARFIDAFSTRYTELNALLGGTSTQYSRANGANFSPSSSVTFNSQRLTDLAAPSAGTDAVNKNYCDANIGGKTVDTGIASLAGGDAGKVLAWDGAKWVAQASASSDATKLPLTGGTMSGAIAMSSQDIINVGHIGVGTTTPVGPLEVAKDWSSAAGTNIMAAMTSYGDAARLTVRRANGTAASPTGSQSGDFLGNINFRGHDGTSFSAAGRAGISGWAAENYTSTAQGTYMVFTTTAVGTTDSTEKMRIDPSGNVGIGTTAPFVSLDLGTRTDAIRLPAGTTAQQPASPFAGMMRWNTSNSKLEYYNGSAWVNFAVSNSSGVMTSVSSVASSTGDLTLSGQTAATNSVTVGNTTPSLGASSGALVVNGGAGIAGELFTGASINAGSTLSAVTSVRAPAMIGSTAASGNLTIDSTSDSTKGNILFAPNGGNVGVGTTTPNALLSLIKSSTADTLPNGLPTLLISNSNPAKGDGTTSWNYSQVRVDAGNGSVSGTMTASYNNAPAYYPDSVILKTNTSHPLAFGTANLERMRIDNTGKVGIGTTAPTAGLEITGTTSSSASIKITNPGAPSTIYPVFSLNHYRNGVGGNPGLDFNVADGNATSPTAVGPGTPLGIISGWGYGDSQFVRGQRIGFFADGTYTNSSSPGYMTFSTTPSGSTSVTERLRITSSGYFGIGTTSPAYRLHVVTDGGVSDYDDDIRMTTYSPTIAPSIILERARGSASAPSALQQGDPILNLAAKGYASSAMAYAVRIVGATETDWSTSVNAYLRFETARNGTITEAMRITSAGHVGIGTTAPQATLDVNGTIRMAKLSAQPFACDAAHDGTLALTSGYRQCVCAGGSATWVFTSDGATTCTW